MSEHILQQPQPADTTPFLQPLPVEQSGSQCRQAFLPDPSEEADPRVADGAQGDQQSNGRKAQAEILIDCASNVEFWRDMDGHGCATVPVGTHYENYPIKSPGFRDWLLQKFYAETGRGPSTLALSEALATLQAKARYGGKLEISYVRVGGDTSTIWLDLGTDDWSAVRISADGWEVIAHPTVKFIRPGGTLPLPIPMTAEPEVLEQFTKLLRIPNTDHVLCIATLFGALRPCGPYPLTILKNERGCGKSTATRALRNVIDPRKPTTRNLPRNEQDLLIAAKRGWILAYDNVSDIDPWLSDAFCRMATGAGGGYRTLYENDEETLFEAARPVILNGITDFVQRDDLVNRSVEIAPEPIPENERKTEAWLKEQLDNMYPVVLGALLTAAAEALKNWSTTQLVALPRMADFAHWVCAGASKLGFSGEEFLHAYNANQQELEKVVLETVLARLVQGEIPFQGTATELLKKLKARANEDERRLLPRAPNTLGGKLRHVAPALRSSGIAEIRFPRGNTKRLIVIAHVQESGAVNCHDRHLSPKDMQDKVNASDSSRDDNLCCDDVLTIFSKEMSLDGTTSDASYADGDDSDNDSQLLSARSAIESGRRVSFEI